MKTDLKLLGLKEGVRRKISWRYRNIDTLWWILTTLSLTVRSAWLHFVHFRQYKSNNECGSYKNVQCWSLIHLLLFNYLQLLSRSRPQDTVLLPKQNSTLQPRNIQLIKKIALQEPPIVRKTRNKPLTINLQTSNYVFLFLLFFSSLPSFLPDLPQSEHETNSSEPPVFLFSLASPKQKSQ